MVRVGKSFYTYDGRVLEIFGGNAIRFHVRHMHVSITDPDRKGNRTVEIAHGRPEAPGLRHIWKYSAAEWADMAELARLLETVRAASDTAAKR